MAVEPFKVQVPDSVLEDLQSRLEPGVVDPVSDDSLIMNTEGGGLREVDLVGDIEAHRTIGIVSHLIDLDATAEPFLAGDDKVAIGGGPARVCTDAGAAAEYLRGRVGEIGDVIDPQTRAKLTDVEPIALSDHVMNSAIGNRP